jgi:excisionase family DNA binding protein
MRPQPKRIASLGEKITPWDARSGAARVLGRARRAVEQRRFSPLIDAKAAGRLLGVPHTWMLAQARAGRIPHHRLGHYVRFDVDDLQTWLRETQFGPPVESAPRRHD